MDILKLIKNRRTIRKYINKPIPKKILDKIIEAGIWGPSLMAPGFQPWRFVVVTKPALIKKISRVLLDKSKKSGAGSNIILHLSADTISNAKCIILVYNSSVVVNLVKRFKEEYIHIAKSAELCAISAALQNMVLVAQSLGLGSCWLDAPLFCREELNKLLGIKDELVAVLTLGYPAEEGRRSPRKPLAETVKFIK